MSQLPLHKFFISDGILFPAVEFEPGKYNGGIYEVVRVVRGVALFLEEHLDRFFNSMEIENKEATYTKTEIGLHLEKLIRSNAVEYGNIMVTFNSNLTAWIIPHSYPTDELYKIGVECGLLKAERKNPNSKVFQTQVRKAANKILAENPFYEVLLVDSKTRVTEGSKSNVFFVCNNKVITAPAKDVLHGITRQKTIKLAGDLNIDLTEKEIYQDEIVTFDSAFLTGTSPKILPIRKIGNKAFDTKNQIVIQLINNYNLLIDNYISKQLLKNQ